MRPLVAEEVADSGGNDAARSCMALAYPRCWEDLGAEPVATHYGKLLLDQSRARRPSAAHVSHRTPLAHQAALLRIRHALERRRWRDLAPNSGALRGYGRCGSVLLTWRVHRSWSPIFLHELEYRPGRVRFPYFARVQ